jgi:hypothetical protein
MSSPFTSAGKEPAHSTSETFDRPGETLTDSRFSCPDSPPLA